MANPATNVATDRLELWAWLWVRMRRYWPRVAVIVLALALDVAFATLFPLGVRVLIDNAVVPGNGQVLLTTLAALAALFAATTVRCKRPSAGRSSCARLASSGRCATAWASSSEC
jgi:hypothetical protein